jgi:hypothetical protein
MSRDVMERNYLVEVALWSLLVGQFAEELVCDRSTQPNTTIKGSGQNSIFYHMPPLNLISR